MALKNNWIAYWYTIYNSQEWTVFSFNLKFHFMAISWKTFMDYVSFIFIYYIWISLRISQFKLSMFIEYLFLSLKKKIVNTFEKRVFAVILNSIVVIFFQSSLSAIKAKFTKSLSSNLCPHFKMFTDCYIIIK